jgi:23S rRNA (cytosine1962-C5)-methyltransferase
VVLVALGGPIIFRVVQEINKLFFLKGKTSLISNIQYNNFMNYPRLKLKPAKEYPIRGGHPWIFSNAIETAPQTNAGDLVAVYSFGGQPLGIGMINPLNSIRVRMISREVDIKIDADFIAKRLKELETQKEAFLPPKTTGYRVCHADADGLPGLIVDRYEDTIVFQIHTAGMEKLRDEAIEGMKKALKPKALVERSDVESRAQESLKKTLPAVIFGKLKSPVTFTENKIPFIVDVLEGQKTGFFLDQRNTRKRIMELSKGKNVLNLFGYTGAASVYAALGKAETVTTVDISAPALAMARKNFELNDLDPKDESKFKFLQEDVFELFKNKTLTNSYDLIICDPPAFAKSGNDTNRALEAYSAINKRCLWMLKEGGILITSSCSGRVLPEDFRNMLKLAAGHTGRDTRILDFFGQPFDHTEKLSFPEGRYLKTAVLQVTRATVEKGPSF